MDTTQAVTTSTTETPPSVPPAGAQNTGSPTGATQTQAQTQTAENMVPQSRFNEVNNELKALKAKAAETEAAEAKAREAQMAAQQRWQELAEQREGELTALRPKAQMADDLSGKLRAQIDAEIAKWPEQVKAMAPAKDAPVTAWLDWADKARALVKELEAAKTPAYGNGRGPKPAGPAGQTPPPDATRAQRTL